MKRRLLMTSAVIALTVGLTPALAQQDRTDSKMKKDPAASEQQDRNVNKQTQKKSAETKDQAGARTTTGQAGGDSANKASTTDTTKSHADKTKSTDSKSAQPKQAEDQNKKPTNGATANKTNTAEPSKNAEQNNTRSPNAQKSTQSGATNAPANAKTNDSNRNAQTNEQNGKAATANTNAEPNTRISASLDPQKKTRVTTAFEHVNVKPVTNVNFSVSIGTVVPRDIEIRPVPTSIVEIVPQYRGYDFFVVRDEVVIVEPRTHKIVDVIEREPSRSRAETTTTMHKPKLSAHQREIIRRHATSKRTTTTGSSTTEISVGERLPDTVEVESVPEEVYREVPAVREYRYIERGDDVYLVDPSTREVIEDVR